MREGRRGRERGAYQLPFGVRARVLPGRLDELRRVLDGLAHPDEPSSARSPFARLSGVHFGRLLVLDEVDDLDGRPIPASLVLMTEVDGPLERHLDELSSAAADMLDATFGLCEGYPRDLDPAARRAFLLAHPLGLHANYVNTVGRSVEQVQREQQLRQAIEGFLDAAGHDLPRSPRAARRAIQQFVESEPSLAWARRTAPRPPLGWRLRQGLRAVGLAVAFVVASPVLLLALPVVALVLRVHEARDSAVHRRPDPEHIRALTSIEDFAAQNQYAAVGFLKPGRFRLALARSVIFLIDVGARHVFIRADLAGIKTIHFARWVVLDEGRRGLFTSSYDGSHENYMDDFVDKIAWALNASFSHIVDWPRTRFLLFGGARQEREFKDYQRLHQIPSQVWYSAYDDLSAQNLDDNASLRSGLFGDMADAEATAWLRRL